MDGGLSAEELAELRRSYRADPHNLLVQNVLTHAELKEVVVDRSVELVHDFEFSHRIETEGKTPNQKSSGRCWIFAAMNVLRLHIMKNQKLGEDFELSQPFLFFWDKLEKANYFLESVLATLHEPIDGRLMAHLLTSPVQDGGQYDMIINLVEKYGLVPKAVYPESAASGASAPLNWLITNQLRECCMVIRREHAAGKGTDELRRIKRERVAAIYKILCAHLGTPPEVFTWTYRNKDKVTEQHPDLTPLSFYEKFIRPFHDVSQNVSLINDPRNKYFSLYTVDFLGNVAGGRPVLYVNIPADVLKALAVKTIQDGQPVWFGCDVGKFINRPKGILDLDVYDYRRLFGTEFRMSKADRLLHGESLMTHAMVLTGVDIQAGNVVKFRIANSWGESSGQSGFLSCSSAWFDEYLYQIVLPKSALPPEIVEVLQQSPTRLPAWDPMGSLA